MGEEAEGLQHSFLDDFEVFFPEGLTDSKLVSDGFSGFRVAEDEGSLSGIIKQGQA